MRARVLFACVAAVALAAEGDWPFYGRDPGGQRFSPLRQITPGNVRRLQVAWTYQTGETLPGAAATLRNRVIAFETTPLVVNGTLYLTTPQSRVVALDPATGRERWRLDPKEGEAPKAGKRPSRAHRGLAHWSDGKADHRLFTGTLDGRLFALRAETGRPIPSFGREGSINLREGLADRFPDADYAMTSPPVIFENLVIAGAAVPEGAPRGPSGAVRAFDARTGRLAWTFHTIPLPGEAGHETWEGDDWKDRTGANVWSMMSVDRDRGLVFLPVGSPSYDFYGGDRPGQNLYGNSVVALDARTGARRWHFQTVHHDLWDYDLPAQPVLLTLRRNGRLVPAVTQVTKSGFVFVLHRETGEPLFPVEERPVPQSDVPGERTWPTQPFPTLPPPLVRHGITREEITDVTPESRRACLAMFDSMQNGRVYTPFGSRLTLTFPGTLGGATWSGASVDPARGWLFVNANELGAVGMMKEQPEGAGVRFRRASPVGEYGRFWDDGSLPCTKPPWGTLQAIDLNTGRVVWKVPLGSLVEGQRTGSPNLGGSTATAGGLVFIGGTLDRRFRAFDARTGKELWSAELPAAAHATPVTYEAEGRQYVVVAAGGGGFFAGKVSDTLVAFAVR